MRIAAKAFFTLAMMGLATSEAWSDDARAARFAGGQLGHVEALAEACPALAVNASRRDEIVGMYAGAATQRSFAEARARSLAAQKGRNGDADPKRCARADAYYGDRGLFISGYLLPTTRPPRPIDGPAPDKSLGVAAAPETVAAMIIALDAGHAMAIEQVCPGYVTSSYLIELQQVFGRIVGIEQFMAIFSMAMAQAGEAYNLKKDRRGFCARILAEWGPDSTKPVVVKAVQSPGIRR